MSWLKETKAGTWRYKVSLGFDSNTGQYESVYGTEKTKERAKKKIREIESQYDRGEYVKPKKQTVAEFLKEWLQDYRHNLGPRTFKAYEWDINRHLIPTIGNLPLTELKSEHLQRVYAHKLQSGRKDGTGGLGDSTVKHVHVILHRALKTAVKLGKLYRNPADFIDVPKVTPREMKFMTESDIHIFLEYARNGEYYALFFLALMTGMRRSELLGLKWDDVDLLMGNISVRRSLHQIGGKIVERPCKTAKSKRLISLSPSTLLMLQEYKTDRQGKIAGIDRKLTNDDYVFAHYDGNALHPDTVTQAWRRLARRCGLAGVRLHDARHSHASLLLKQNVHPLIVSQRLGHADVKTTLNVYSHILPGLQEAAARKLDDIFSSSIK